VLVLSTVFLANAQGLEVALFGQHLLRREPVVSTLLSFAFVLDFLVTEVVHFGFSLTPKSSTSRQSVTVLRADRTGGAVVVGTVSLMECRASECRLKPLEGELWAEGVRVVLCESVGVGFQATCERFHNY